MTDEYAPRFRDRVEHKELRAAIRAVEFRPRRLKAKPTWAKQAGMTTEAFINAEVDAFLGDPGTVESFQLFRANHGRYPTHNGRLPHGTYVLHWARCSQAED